MCQKQETKNFSDKMFNGSVGMLVSLLVKESRLPSEERDGILNIKKAKLTQKGGC